MGNRRGLLMFTRSPEEEALAKGLPAETGARLFDRLLGAWRGAALEASAEFLIAAPSSSVGSLAGRLTHPASIASQRGASPSERLRDALHRAFERGLAAVLVVGGDSPPPARDLLQFAFELLEAGKADVVLEPSTDGGVNLIGLSSDCTAILESARWGSAWFAEDVRRASAARGDRVFLLPSIADLDGIADVARALRRSCFDPVWRDLHSLLRAVLQSSASSRGRDTIFPRSRWAAPSTCRAPPIAPPAS
jgi:glycosyltransferase A (GT-A) superfamily protein (DUF2064 family)